MALTTRAVGSAASVQAPTLYRLFGQKRGLLDAVAEHDLAAFVTRKASAERDPDPVQDLADAWDNYDAFGVASPTVFAIITEIGTPGSASTATLAGITVLRERVQRVAKAGRFGVPVEQAVGLIHAAGVGTVTTLLAIAETKRDPQLPSVAWRAVMAAILIDAHDQRGHTSLASLAIALGARLGEVEAITPGERLLLSELMSRLSTAE